MPYCAALGCNFRSGRNAKKENTTSDISAYEELIVPHTSTGQTEEEHMKQLGVHYLGQEYPDMLTGTEDKTQNLWVKRRPLYHLSHAAYREQINFWDV
ncbi:uncharacterized protein LOC133400305 isoform X9 [Phycodurus eques]|uniref:uncharacterized protein LOC133400305 isoform X9 n=1 Tax=Phycodurus eques TaxID=693459 RepID=UPI002ACE5E31|nr:uncharacterized protein LOC133400305 isoform X9 [Phycodurus eques]